MSVSSLRPLATNRSGNAYVPAKPRLTTSLCRKTVYLEVGTSTTATCGKRSTRDHNGVATVLHQYLDSAVESNFQQSSMLVSMLVEDEAEFCTAA